MTLKLEDFEPVGYRYVSPDGSWSFDDKEPGDIAEHVYSAAKMQQVIDQCNAKDETLKDHGEIQKSICDQLAAAQAENERLRDALINCQIATDWTNVHRVAKEALATTSPSDALREHDAKLVEMIASAPWDSPVIAGLKMIADKIRKGEF